MASEITTQAHHAPDRLVRRGRAFARMLRTDTPFTARIAAHGAVLVVALAALLSSRLATVQASGTSASLAELAARVGQEGRELAPEPVLSTDAVRYQGWQVASEMPGFISTGAIPEADTSLLPWDEPQRYIVQPGDTVSEIAAQFGRAPETLLFANPSIRDDPHNLSVGDEITILPVDGVLHIVEEGDTIESLATKYNGTAAAVVSYTPNGLEAALDVLVPGTEVVIPGGVMDIVIPPLVAAVGRGSASWAPGPNFGGPLVGTGAFHLGAYGRITNGYSRWHPAVDIANGYGTPIYAIDSGVVEIAGWYDWAGNAVTVDHGNGYESLYAHMQDINVSAGQTVQRGQIIGTIGCTRGAGGRCTGPHLHLETFFQGGYVNPCSLGACP